MAGIVQLLLAGAVLMIWGSPGAEKRKFTFYKEVHGTWYIDLPDYPGPKGDLAMVAGADDTLDFLAKGGKQVTVEMSEQPFDGALALERTKLGEPGGGAYYKPVNHAIQSVWLCDITVLP